MVFDSEGGFSGVNLMSAKLETVTSMARDDSGVETRVEGETLPAREIAYKVNAKHVSRYISENTRTGERIVNEVYTFKGRRSK
jgi:ribosomal protein S6